MTGDGGSRVVRGRTFVERIEAGYVEIDEQEA